MSQSEQQQLGRLACQPSVEAGAAAVETLRMLEGGDEKQPSNHLHAGLAEQELCPPLPVVKQDEQQHQNCGDAKLELLLECRNEVHQ